MKLTGIDGRVVYFHWNLGVFRGAMSSFWIIFESSLFATYSQGKLQIMEHNPS
jgi:hypothetical protein